MSDRKFIKNKEDFVCDHCGEKVAGNGYTNHCPKCLWSKHVDVNPGDRAEGCLGIMKPEKIIAKKDTYAITHVCQRCGFERNQTLSKDDDFDEVITIIKSANDKLST